MKIPEHLEDVAARTRVLKDRLLIMPLLYQNPVLWTPQIALQKGLIVAVGSGRRRRRKVRFDQMEGHLNTQRSFYFEDGEETGVTRPMRVRVGQVVEFSPRNYTEVDFDRIGFPGAGKLLVVWENAVMSIDPKESQSEALMWKQSAGYDRNGNFMSGAENFA
jgi:hypothetical protein